MKNNILKIKLLDGSEYQIEITGDLFKKLGLKTKKDSLDFYTLDKIISELNPKPGNKILNSEISEIEIPNCINEIFPNTFDRYSNLEGIKINGNPKLDLGALGHHTLSLRCVISSSKDIENYIKRYCAPDVKIFSDHKLYDQAMQKVKEQETQECKALITCKTGNGKQVYEFIYKFEDSKTNGGGLHFNEHANVIKKDFFNKFCKRTGVKLEDIIGVKIFEGPRAIADATFLNLTNLQNLELPKSIYYLCNGSVFTENRLHTLILPCSLINLYSDTEQEKIIHDPFMISENDGGPRFLLLKDYKNQYKYNSDNINDFLDLIHKKYSGTQIFSDEEKFKTAMDKGFIKIKDTNGKIYEHEIEFTDHTKESNHKYSKEHSKKEKYLSESMVGQILQKFGLKNEDVLEVEISNVKILGFDAFMDCVNMRKIILHDGLENICNNSLFGCYSLESLHIPESVKHVGLSAAAFCKSLKDLVIGKNAHICKSSFTENPNLKIITIIENPEAEEVIKQAMEKGFISKSVKIFHSLKERDDFYRANKEINNQETKIQKRSYSDLLSFKLLIPLYNIIWVVYTLVCIKIANEQRKKTRVPRMEENNHKRNSYISFQK